MHETWSLSALLEAAFIEHQDELDNPCPATVELQTRGTREVLDALLTLCRSPDARWRSLAARILGELGQPDRTFPEECCNALIGLLRDPDEDVVIAALYALGHLGNHRCDAELLMLKDHPEPTIRRGVAFSLAGTTLPAAVPALLQLMEDLHTRTRDWATTTLGSAVCFDAPEIRDALLRRARLDDDEIVRGEALHGLTRRGDRRAVPLLIAELSMKLEFPDYFKDAAKTSLGIDDAEEISVEDLLGALRAHRH